MRLPRRRLVVQLVRPMLRRAAQFAAAELLENRRLLSAVAVNTIADQTDPPGSSTVSLRDALATASLATTPTTITFDPTVFASEQTISLANETALDIGATSDVTIIGPAAGVIISGGGLSNDLIDNAGPQSTVSLSNMTFTDGRSNYGGGIEHNGNDTLTLTNVTLSNNTAYYDGGGIWNSGNLVVTGSTITENSATNVEGGFGAGGGIDNAGGTLTMIDSTVSGNTSQSINAIGGGGIANIRGGTATLTGCTLSGNSTYANQPGGTLVEAPGGGIFSTGPLTITNSTISGNTGSLGGGAYISDGVTLSDSTISGNTGTRGGGLYLTTDDTLQNTVVSGNTYLSGGSGPDVQNRPNDAVVSNGFNFIGESDGSTGWAASDKIGTIADPIDADLGPLADNGGPTLTMLPQPGSPLIDAGSNALIPAGISTDQRGEPRTFDNTVDIGAVETQSLINVSAPADQSAIAGQSQSFDLGSFTETGGTSPFSVVVNWGDGSANTTFSQAAAGTLTPQPHAYAAAGDRTVTVTVTDASGALTAANSFQISVGGESIDVTGPADQTAFAGISQSFSLGSFTQTNAAGPYTVAVDWGDGSADSTFTINSAGTIPAQSHTYSATGNDTVTVNVADASGAITSGASFDVTVAAGSIAIAPAESQNAQAGHSKSILLGSFTESNATGPFGVNVTWGDGSADTIFTVPAAGALPAQFHTFPRVGSDTVTVTVSDASGLIRSSGSFSVVVTSAGITVNSPGNQSAFVGKNAVVSLGSFTETDASAPYAISVNWGDGSAAAALNQSAPGALAPQSHTFAALGSYSITVTVTDASGLVSGDATFTVTVTNGNTPTATRLGISNTSFGFAESQTLSATVTPASATGVVTFFQNGVALGTAALAGGTATLSSTAFSSGSDRLTAIYGGDGTFAGSTSPAITITVAPPANTALLSLRSSSVSIDYGQALTLTATVSPASSNGVNATGIVTFYQATSVLGTAELQTDGMANFTTTTPLPAGTDSLTASYSGDANFSASISGIVNITVTPAQTVTALALSTPSKTLAQQVTFTATVSSATLTPGGMTPGGIVTFSANGSAFGTAIVGAAGTATLSSSAALPLGQDSITAIYSGDANFVASISAPQQLEVTPHALVPVVNRATVPSVVIAGTRIKGSIQSTLTNQLSDSTTDIEKGIYSLRIFAALTSMLDPASDTVIATVSHTAKLARGKAVRLTVPITTFPTALAPGTYHLLLETTDSGGNSEWTNTGATVNVVAPVISLAATFVSVPANVLKKGAIVSLVNTGNINDLSRFTATIGLATSPTASPLLTSGPGKLQPTPLLLRPGKTAALHITGWQSLPSALPAGTYYLTVTLTDSTGHTAFTTKRG